jgi:hypothetical protein
VRVLAVDQSKSAQRPEIFFAIGSGGLGHCCEVRGEVRALLFFNQRLKDARRAGEKGGGGGGG